MNIPRAWAKESAEAKLPDGRMAPVWAWGWGDDEPGARKVAAERLRRVLERLRRGEPFPRGSYGYGNRPLREEILQTLGGATPSESRAVVTRNAYGAQVLNAARLLFLDVDFSAPGIGQRLRQLFGGDSTETEALAKLRAALRSYGRATFRIYRTASGLRGIAVEREFDPTGREGQELMQATGTDPAFLRLCVAQNSFRARLTPKPWRCKMPNPPGRYPRHGEELRRKFAAWLSDYDKASARYATCRYLETIGSGSPAFETRRLLELHDRTTRCNEALPLA